MNIPDAAIEDAAKVMREHDAYKHNDWHHWTARAAIEAAMPAIREAIAQEIEADNRHHPTAWEHSGLARAARIVRGGAA